MVHLGLVQLVKPGKPSRLNGDGRTNEFQSFDRDLLCAWVRHVGQMIKLLCISFCCQLINRINCIREGGLKERGRKIDKELIEVLGLQGKKIKKYSN